MAPNAQTSKRTAESKASASKRAKVIVTPVERRVNAVMSALTCEDTVVPGPASCRAMFVTAAPTVLKTPKDERHADQEALFTMLREIFDAEKTRWEARVGAANGAVENATAEQTEQVAVKDAADAALKAQKDAVKEQVEAQSKALEVVEECKEEASAVLALHVRAQAARGDIAKKQKIDLSLKEIIDGFKGGSCENYSKDVKKHITAVSAFFQSLGAEEALVKTLPQILRKKPEERGGFDEIVLQQLDSYMNDHLASLSSQLEDADKVVTEHATAITAWGATVEVAEDKLKESDEALDAAKTQQEQLQQELNTARKTLKEHTAVVKRRNADLATEQCGLQVVEGVLEALEFLQEYIAPAPEHEETMEVETVAANASPATKVKEIDVSMNFDDVPSPSKKNRVSLGGESAPTLVA